MWGILKQPQFLSQISEETLSFQTPIGHSKGHILIHPQVIFKSLRSHNISLKQVVYQTAEELIMTKSGHMQIIVYREIVYWQATGMVANS